MGFGQQDTLVVGLVDTEGVDYSPALVHRRLVTVDNRVKKGHGGYHLFDAADYQVVSHLAADPDDNCEDIILFRVSELSYLSDCKLTVKMNYRACGAFIISLSFHV